MFESIRVSEGTRKPWTVVVSFAGQCALIGLSVLLPLMTHDALPHGRLAGVFLPEPRGDTPPHGTQKPVHAKPIPFQPNPKSLEEPRQIPQQVALIEDPDLVSPSASEVAGVPFGTNSAPGLGNGVIDGIARAVPTPAPPAPIPAKQSSPATTRRIAVVSRLEAAKLMFGPRPVYPPLAKAARVSGAVRLRAVIARDGTIMDLQVVSGQPLLVPAALGAVKQWVFQPTYLNGEPVEVATEIVVAFTLGQ